MDFVKNFSKKWPRIAVFWRKNASFHLLNPESPIFSLCRDFKFGMQTKRDGNYLQLKNHENQKKFRYPNMVKTGYLIEVAMNKALSARLNLIRFD